MSDNMRKGLQTILFHHPTDFILGHVPHMYSPVYDTIVDRFSNHTLDIDNFVPPSFTTPLTATAAWVHAPIFSDYKLNPWLVSLGMDSTIHSFLHLRILFVHAIYQTVDCGGVISDRLVDT